MVLMGLIVSAVVAYATPDTGTDVCEQRAEQGAAQASVKTVFSAPTRCNIERVALQDMTLKRFLSQYQNRRPVIVVHGTDHQRQFVEQTSRDNMLRDWGQHLVTLGTANTNTGKTTKQTLLTEYLE